ncbi:hypothetical protein ACFVTE_19155 [Arthrobacter sp. NPDC058097]|uniref:hypothetical protein n=1 Tax=Arthrobacter sp. NPDC058097 TaxID=3346340 RepID=UPI0036DCB90F
METFLRRADRFDLHAASVTEVERSFTETFASADMTLTPQLAGTVRKPPAATRSRPTDGCYLWQEAEKRSRRIDAAAVSRAAAGRRRNAHIVIQAALSTASGRDQDFLQAMAEDPGASATTHIRGRTGARPNAVGNYRTRLRDAALIKAATSGIGGGAEVLNDADSADS